MVLLLTLEEFAFVEHSVPTFELSFSKLILLEGSFEGISVRSDVLTVWSMLLASQHRALEVEFVGKLNLSTRKVTVLEYACIGASCIFPNPLSVWL